MRRPSSGLAVAVVRVVVTGAPSVVPVPPAGCGGTGGTGGSAEEGGDSAVGRLHLLDLRDVAGFRDELDAAVGDAGGELLRVHRRDQRVVLAPHDEGGRGDAVQALVQAAVRDGPTQ